MHRKVLLGIILRGLVIGAAAPSYGRRVSGEDTDAQAILNLGRAIVNHKNLNFRKLLVSI